VFILRQRFVQVRYEFPFDFFGNLEFCLGGDLGELLMALGSLEEEDARLYFAEMIEAIHALHSMGYIHRDIKPEVSFLLFFFIFS